MAAKQEWTPNNPTTKIQVVSESSIDLYTLPFTADAKDAVPRNDDARTKKERRSGPFLTPPGNPAKWIGRHASMFCFCMLLPCVIVGFSNAISYKSYPGSFRSLLRLECVETPPFMDRTSLGMCNVRVHPIPWESKSQVSTHSILS